MRRPDQPKTAASGAVKRRRQKLGPDPAVQARILNAGVDVVREHGTAALNLTEVLNRANLSTRAFYRHFESMDHLIQAVFVHLARSEALRLRTRMNGATNPVAAVASWIDGRLDLAFDELHTSGLRHFSLEAQSLMFASPDKVSAAFAEMLQPLVEQLERGRNAGVFRDIDPEAEAESIHGVVWACTHQHWNRGNRSAADVRRRTTQFCLRGLGVAPDAFTNLFADDPEQFSAGHHP